MRWTKENVFTEAKKYSTKNEFQKGCGSAYNVALKNGWLSEMTWFKQVRKPKGFWTKENVFSESMKYRSKSKFAVDCSSAYNVARKNGWLDEMDWLVEIIKPNGYWTKERIFAEAKKYQTRKEFSKGCSRAYDVARVNGWLDEMDWLVNGRIKLFTDKIDCVYRYLWKETNFVYIGRTIDKKERDNQHRTRERDLVLRYANENGLEVPPMEIIENNLTLEEGLDREDYWKNYYKNMGYNILNKAKTGKGSGSLGTINNGKWNRKSVFAEAKKYQTKNKFRKGCSRAYNVALKNKWLEEMTWFNEIIKPKGYWNKENVFAEAKKYKARTEFQDTCGSAYISALKNGWLDEMEWFARPIVWNKKWNKKSVFEEAKKYKTRSEFAKACSKAYSLALKNGWLDKMTFKEIKKPNGYWSKERVFVEARKYNTRAEFYKDCGSAYNVARKNGWLDELFP